VGLGRPLNAHEHLTQVVDVPRERPPAAIEEPPVHRPLLDHAQVPRLRPGLVVVRMMTSGTAIRPGIHHEITMKVTIVIERAGRPICMCSIYVLICNSRPTLKQNFCRLAPRESTQPVTNDATDRTSTSRGGSLSSAHKRERERGGEDETVSSQVTMLISEARPPVSARPPFG
jgi:hypothetical protein